MLGMEIEKAVLILVNKTNLYQIKPIWFDLDYGYAETLIHKAELVNTHVKANTLPPKINQPDECSRCPFNHICMPDLAAGEGLKLVDNAEIEELLQQRTELEPAKKEFDGVERQLKKLLVPGQDAIIGDYLVRWTEVTVNYKAKEAYTTTQQRKSITQLKTEAAKTEDAA